jgi:1-acyl-sn-glycerol-3-phosphate acyltransferase
MTLRRIRRAVVLGFELILCMVRFWLLRLRGPITLERKARWGQQTARRLLASLDIKCRVEGNPPTQGLVVSNHLSYLDVPILAAAMPCFFVAKIEIGGWPFFGKAALACGTIFLDRSSLASARSVAEQMTERFKLPIPIPLLLFPEGTSTDGSEVIRFHSRLIDPATSLGVPITTAAIRYAVADGTPEREVCWYGDETFVHHMWKVLGVGGFEADLRFGSSRVYADRRRAADATHDEIAEMRMRQGAEKQGTREQGDERTRDELVTSER